MSQESEQQVARRRRQQRLAEVFGEAVPEQVRDDVDAARPGGARGAGGDLGDEWWREQVPPHHGG